MGKPMYFVKLTPGVARRVADKIGVWLGPSGEMYLDTMLEVVVVWP